MSLRNAEPVLQTDTATCSSVSALVTDTVLLATNQQRVEVVISNLDVTNFVIICPGTAAATLTTGIKLAPGAMWTSRAFTGPLRVIASTGTCVLGVVEMA